MNRWPGAPSEVPSDSSRTVSACAIPAVPPIVIAWTPEIRGLRVYAGVTPSGGSTRHRSQPARCRAFTDCSWVAGTCRTTSPALFSPPVSSRSTSQALQPEPFHASHASGGLRGSMPMPPTGQLIRSSTAHDGTAADSPISIVSPGTGTVENAGASAPSARSRVWSVIAPSLVTAAKLLNEHGTIGRSATVLNTTGSSTSVRGVATSVSARTSTVAGWAAASQNVAVPRAAVDG